MENGQKASPGDKQRKGPAAGLALWRLDLLVRMAALEQRLLATDLQALYWGLPLFNEDVNHLLMTRNW